MEIMIDIPEELYEAYKNKPPMLGDAGMDMIVQSIANGTPLPEHHGRLIDADAIPKHLVRDMDEIDKQPTIIEADKGSDSE